MVGAHPRRVVDAEVHEVPDQILLAALDDPGDRLLRLEVDDGVVAVGVRDAVDLGRGPAEVGDDHRDVVGLVQVGPGQVELVGRDLVDDVAHTPHAREPQERVGVDLQRPLADHGAFTLVGEEVTHARLVDHVGQRRVVGLLHRQDDVVLVGLVEPLDQHAVGGRPALPMPNPERPTTSLTA